MPTPAEMLAGVPLFSLLHDQERADLAERLERIEAPAGKTMFLRGDPGNAMYIVRSGSVEIFFKNDTGERIVLETATPGHFFGEISLLDEGPRTASAVVKENLDALVVDRGDLADFLKSHPEAAMDLLAAMGRRLRDSAKLLRHSVSRDINEETEDKRTKVMKVADWISDFSGSLPFLFIHIGIFFVWIILNVGPLGRMSFGGFDPFPFGLLTMVVSLEAIILSVFVLLSQNRQVARDRVRNDIEYQVNLKAELEIGHLHEKIDDLHEMIARQATIDRTKDVAR
jgi:CRP/FNR family transcriptional regulator, cyclic AMP receptor protein